MPRAQLIATDHYQLCILSGVGGLDLGPQVTGSKRYLTQLQTESTTLDDLRDITAIGIQDSKLIQSPSTPPPTEARQKYI